MDAKPDEVPYHERLQPFASREDMTKAMDAFMADVEALVSKYRLPDAICAAVAFAMVDGRVGHFETSRHVGNVNNAVPLLASTLGNWRGREYERVSVLRMDPRDRIEPAE